METREPRREVIEAVGKVLKHGEIEIIRHRAIVREERTESGESVVFVRELTEEKIGDLTQGKYTENGEIWQIGADGGRWKGRNEWQPVSLSFEEAVGQYRYLSEKPNGWWGSDNEATFSTYLNAKRWQDEHEIEGQPIRHQTYTDDQGERREEWAILTQDGYEPWRGREE